MKRRMTMGQLRRLFTEGAISRLLNEDDSMAHQSGASGDSLDAQVDRYLAQYESSAKQADGMEPSVDQMESIDWRDLVKGHVITEAGEDEDPPEDAPAPAPVDDEPAKLGVDSLDVESFANDVARMIQSYDSLLEVRSTLLRRAQSFLEKSYDDDVVTAFKDSMRDDHGMEAGASTGDIEAEKFTAPAADRASGSAQAGPGGGGAPM